MNFKGVNHMSYLYVCEQGAKISFKNFQFIVYKNDNVLQNIPCEALDSINLFGNIQISASALKKCLQDGINIIFYSLHGSYYGRLISTAHINAKLQRKQVFLGENEHFKLEFAKNIINAKINNQEILIKRYSRNNIFNPNIVINKMHDIRKKILSPETLSISQIMGYEGVAARLYFETIGQLVDSNFTFKNRTRRPPLDPYNSLISLGYSILNNEIYGKIEAAGLNPYFGFLHKDREKHPTLASDLLEE